MKLADGMGKMLEVFLEESISEYFFYKENGEWKEGYPDPDLFADGDKGLYLYWGCGDAIYGVKLNDDDPSQIDTEVKTLIKFNPKNEWERAGAYNQNKKVAWTEGKCYPQNVGQTMDDVKY